MKVSTLLELLSTVDPSLEIGILKPGYLDRPRFLPLTNFDYVKVSENNYAIPGAKEKLVIALEA